MYKKKTYNNGLNFPTVLSTDQRDTDSTLNPIQRKVEACRPQAQYPLTASSIPLISHVMSAYASTPSSHLAPVLPTSKRTQPSIPTDDTIKKRLLRKGVNPTPKILHNLRKKETLKSLRRAKKQALSQNPPPLTDAQKQALAEDEHFRTIRAEYCEFRRDLIRRRPWEKEKNVVDLNNVLGSGEEVGLRGEHLEELREMFKERNRVKFQWLLDDDLEEDVSGGEKSYRDSIKLKKRAMGDEQKIKLIVKR